MIEDWTEADDVIEEVREIRRRISARFDHDPRKLGAYLRELEKDYTGPMLPSRTAKGNQQRDGKGTQI